MSPPAPAGQCREPNPVGSDNSRRDWTRCARWRAVGPWPAHAPGRPKWNAIFNLALVAAHPALGVIIVPGVGWDLRPRPPLRLAGAPEGRTWPRRRTGRGQGG